MVGINCRCDSNTTGVKVPGEFSPVLAPFSNVFYSFCSSKAASFSIALAVATLTGLVSI
jgi:hypothetical protein